ncbi:MAG: ABC transporter permease [Actinobacteria bacterium]|nr:ABC transporter permease [Actinomycetota bacterium]
MSRYLAGFRMQLRAGIRTPSYWMTILTTPAQTILFLSVITAFDRPDLTAHAVIAPAVVSMWGASVWTGGAIVRNDRWGAMLELHAATPTSYAVPVIGRMSATLLLSLAAIPLAMATAWLTFGLDVGVRHPWVLAAALVVTTAAMVSTALIFTSMTVLSRAAITFQNSASYPILLLGGAFVPLDLLPGWVHPIGRLIFLSWGTDLVRDSITAATVEDLWLRLGMVLLLGAAGLAAGTRLLRMVMHRVTVTGEISVT